MHHWARLLAAGGPFFVVPAGRMKKTARMTKILPEQITQAAALLDGIALRTPVLPLSSDRWAGLLPEAARVTMKLELFQQAGSFKARGAYLGLHGLSKAERATGITAVSGGNHALAISWAAQKSGVKARVHMPQATDPVRIDGCVAMGADVRLHPDIATAFAAMQADADAGRTALHPFEAPHMLLGSATCGAEFAEQVPDLDMLVLPVGGGGLIAGMAAAFKLARPQCRVIGVEPTGADSMGHSIAAGAPVTLEKVDTIADSLGAPYALPLSFGLARDYVDQMVTIPDQAMRDGMRVMMDNLRIMAEPACAASLAAVMGPLKADLAGKNVGVIACGSNIGIARYQALLA